MLDWYGASTSQVSELIGHMIDAVEEHVPKEYTTTYKAVTPEGVGPAQRDQILGNLSKITIAHGYGPVSVLVRRAEDGKVGPGFWTYIAPDVAPENRDNFMDYETRFIHERSDSVVRILRFVRDEVQRKN